MDLWTPVILGRLTPGATVIMTGDALSDHATWTKVIKGSGSFPVTVATISGLPSEGKVDKPPTIVVS